MNPVACEACLRQSMLRNEALRFAERTYSSTVDAARLLRLTPEVMLTELRRLHPDVEQAMGERMGLLLDEAAETHGLWTVCMHDSSYPPDLEAFTDQPAVLYGVGRATMLDELAATEGVAIVGARRATAYGREVAYTLGNEASTVGLVVVSGMALGIDGAAHRGALQGGGRTIAVLAGGPERPYPRSHRLLYEQIVDRGCAISESPPGSEARRWAFVARNRIIAAMAGMTVFVEGGDSSGAKHTVEFARDASKLVGAIPGPVTSPMSTGPNAELADAERGEAHVVRDVSDVLDALALDGKAPTLPGFGADPDDGISDLERHVLELLGSGERTPRQLAQALPERDPREISRVLGALELRGRIVRDSTGEYGRIL